MEFYFFMDEKAEEQLDMGKRVFELSKGTQYLERLPISKLKDALKSLLKDKPSIERNLSIKLIKAIIAHKKGRINLMQ